MKRKTNGDPIFPELKDVVVCPAPHPSLPIKLFSSTLMESEELGARVNQTTWGIGRFHQSATASRTVGESLKRTRTHADQSSLKENPVLLHAS